MERRAFIEMLCIGMGAVVTFSSAKAMNAAVALEKSGGDRPAEPAVATEDDLQNVKLEDAYYGHWRRVNRRVYRRHYYY
jgi:hypothetical protein